MPTLDDFSVEWGRAMQASESHGNSIVDHENRILVLERKVAIIIARATIVVSGLLVGLPLFFKYVL